MVADGIPLPPEFMRKVTLECRAEVGGEVVVVRVEMVEAVYDEPAVRKAIEENLRIALMVKILEKWTPKIHVHR